MEATVRQAVASAFYDANEAENAIRQLEDAGFDRDQIGVAVKEESKLVDRDWIKDLQNDAVEGATAGGLAGGLLGGLLGAGLAIAIPGVGAAVGAGIIAAMAASGLFGGGLYGAFTKMGIDDNDAQYLENQFQEGAIILTVHDETPSRRDEAREILRRTNSRSRESL